MSADEKQRRWYWTAEQAQGKDAVSFLGIVETLIASSVMISVVWIWNEWAYLLAAAVIAPFLLLRTEESTALGIRIFRPALRRVSIVEMIAAVVVAAPLDLAMSKKVHYKGYVGGTAVMVLAIPVVVLGVTISVFFYGCVVALSVIVRIASTAWTVVRHPIKSISAIPRNWSVACFEVDLTKLFEIVPGVQYFPITTHMGPPGRFNAICWDETFFAEGVSITSFIREQIRLDKEAGDKALHPFSSDNMLIYVTFTVLWWVLATIRWLQLIPAFVALLAAWVYRLSIKSSAVIWLPLLYIADDVLPSRMALDGRLDRMHTSAIGRVARVYASFIGLLLVMKFVTQIVSYKVLSTIVNDTPWLAVAEPLIRPIDIPVWQLLSVANAALAWLLFFYIDWELHRREWGRGSADATVENILGATILTRWLITSYTLTCTIYAIYQIVKRSHPPPYHLLFFPWS